MAPRYGAVARALLCTVCFMFVFVFDALATLSYGRETFLRIREEVCGLSFVNTGLRRARPGIRPRRSGAERKDWAEVMQMTWGRDHATDYWDTISLQQYRELFRTVFSREESPPQKAHTHSEESNITEDHPIQCPLCGMFYRHQEWKDQLHNFNDHIILDIHLCLTLRNLLQAHTAVSRAVEFLQDMTGLKFPPADTVLHAYLHFEALTDHEYKYSCITCGDHPPVVIMDLHKKGVFHLSVSDLQGPAENFDGEVNLEKFWEAMSCDMIGRGFVASGRHNPCAVSPTYHFWAPWIGKATRRSDSVLNTEFEKIHVSKSVSEISEMMVTEDRLREELYKQKVGVIRKLCKECGLDTNGSRSDLLLRLSNEMKSRQTYDKIFDKIWGASGGWAVIMCPCGIVYSIKCNLRAENPRDFADLLLSWKHMPNVIIYDFARGLATHLSLRASEKRPISPFEGRLAEPTQSNIELAKCGQLKKTEPDLNGHPVTGSSDHYVLYDRFHEANTKDSKDVLRKLTLVPQLAGKVNSQSLPSTHLFQMRNIHHYNEKKNNKLLERLKKTFGGMMVKNVYGQAVFSNPCFSPEEAGGTDVVMEDNTPAATVITTGGFPAACRIRAVSRSDEGPSPGPDDNTVLKCQLVCPYGGSLYHSTDKALSGKFVSRSYP
ncbi:unnamed protein product [Leuciscus chuanchicus]